MGEGGGSVILQVSLTACTNTNSLQKYKEGNDGSDRSEHTSGKWEGGGGRGSVILQVTLTA